MCVVWMQRLKNRGVPCVSLSYPLFLTSPFECYRSFAVLLPTPFLRQNTTTERLISPIVHLELWLRKKAEVLGRTSALKGDGFLVKRGLEAVA